MNFDLTQGEISLLKKLNTPIKIQNFLDGLPINFERSGETYMSPRRVIKNRTAHCLEGALLSATALWIQGKRPLLLDLKTTNGDDHVISLFKINGLWGAISKTNHASLRFRDPIYKTIRELACSYFHEYFDNDNGRKILESYSAPFDLSRLGTYWITTPEELFEIAEKIDKSRHYRFYPLKSRKYLRCVNRFEISAGKLTEWHSKQSK